MDHTDHLILFTSHHKENVFTCQGRTWKSDGEGDHCWKCDAPLVHVDELPDTLYLEDGRELRLSLESHSYNNVRPGQPFPADLVSYPISYWIDYDESPVILRLSRETEDYIKRVDALVTEEMEVPEEGYGGYRPVGYYIASQKAGKTCQQTADAIVAWLAKNCWCY